MSSQADARIRELMQRVVDESPPPPTLPLGSPMYAEPTRTIPSWVITIAAATAVMAGAVWILVQSAPGTPDLPPAVPATSTTEAFQAQQLEPEALPVFPLREIPGFVGLLEVQTGFGGVAQMSIEYGGRDSGLRVELISDTSALDAAIPFGALIEGGRGSYIVFDGANGEIHLLRDGAVDRWNPEGPQPEGQALGSLDWRDDNGGLGGVCERMSHVAKPIEEVAGREAHVIECVGMGQAFTAWVDAQTGLVLRVAGGDQVVYPVIDGFEFVTIQYPDSLDTSAFQVEFPANDAPDNPIDSCEPDCSVDEIKIAEAEMRAMLDEMDRDVGLTGNPAPPLHGVLLDGSPFSLEDMSGQPVLLHFWFPSIQILLYENRGDWNFARESFEAEAWAAETWGGQVVVVSVAPGDIDLVEAIVQSEAIVQNPDPNILVVIPNDYSIDRECDCPEVWDFPFQPGNTWVLIDSDGIVAGSFYQWYPTIDALDVLLERLSEEAP